MEGVPGLDEPAVEFLILADYVEAVHGKLYMMGGGWENIGVHDFEVPVQLSVAVAVQIPWNATNRTHTLAVEVQTADGEVLESVGTSIVAGRPPHIEHGSSQRTALAFKIPVVLAGPGTYVVEARLNDAIGRRATFAARPVYSGPAAV